MLGKKDTMYLLYNVYFQLGPFHGVHPVNKFSIKYKALSTKKNINKRKYHLHGLQKSDGSDFPSCLLVIQGEII